jgi:hypothetical protein
MLETIILFACIYASFRVIRKDGDVFFGNN